MTELETKLAKALREVLSPFSNVHDGISKQLDKGREAPRLYDAAKEQP